MIMLKLAEYPQNNTLETAKSLVANYDELKVELVKS